MNRFPRPVLALLLALAAGSAVAQALPPAPTAAQATAPRSGDSWIDGRLADMDAYAATYRNAFVDELVRYHRAPRDLVTALLARPGWTAGDVYFACRLAMQAGRPCRAVAALRDAPPAKPWAAIAADLGVTPGSPGYLELKRAIVATYDRWARPVTMDAQLAPLFPGRPAMPSPPHAHTGTDAPKPAASRDHGG